MPTAPLIRLQLDVMDRPEDPYRFESFSNVAAEDQAEILANLANQEELYIAFYGDDLYQKVLEWITVQDTIEAMEFELTVSRLSDELLEKFLEGQAD